MGWMILFFLAALWGAGVEAAVGEDPTAALLEQRYDRESNPRKRTNIAMELTKLRLDQLRAAYETVEPEQQKAAVEAFLDALERLGTAVTAASHVGTSKKAEMHLRRQERDLGNLKTNVSYFERPAIEKLLERAAAVRERILYSIMSPAKRN
ncbi:MAG: hypothetical protein ACRD88_05530 [Terriglobia bacterium]